MAFFKVNRDDPKVVEGRSVGPCNCSRFVWQVTNVDVNLVRQYQEVCIDCRTATGRSR